jgi:hypothetical protein
MVVSSLEWPTGHIAYWLFLLINVNDTKRVSESSLVSFPALEGTWRAMNSTLTAVLSVGNTEHMCWMSHCQGSPSLMGDPSLRVRNSQSPRDWLPHACDERRDDQSRSCTSTCRARRARVPPASLDLEDMRLRYDAYHGSTRLPPGSTITGEPIQHEQAVQGGTRLRRMEMRLKEKSNFQQHEQGLAELRSNRITHMTPRLPGVVRQAQAPIKKAVLGDEDSGEEDDEEEENEQSPQYFQGFEDEDEEREGVGPGPEPPQIVPSLYELEPEETPRYWQELSGDGKRNENKTIKMRQLKARAKAGDKEALRELQEMVMASLMTELDSEPEEAPRTSRSEASRRAVYTEYSPPPRSGAR